MTIEKAKNQGKQQRNYTKIEAKKKKSDNFKRSNREKCNIHICYRNIEKFILKNNTKILFWGTLIFLSTVDK